MAYFRLHAIAMHTHEYHIRHTPFSHNKITPKCIAMHKIDTPDATRDGRFTEGDPTVPIPATTVSADWLNAVQDEVLAVLSAAGLAPAKNNNAQLLAALKKIVGTVNALTATRLETARAIDGVPFDGTADIHHYTTCATAAGTAAKTAALAGFKLQTGSALRVKFANANTAAGATLNVGGTGEKPLYYQGKAVPAGLPAAGRMYTVVFNGAQYEIVGDLLVLAAGGGLAFDVKGHLYVDFSLVPPEQMRSIVLSMMQQGGGLNADGNGKLYVDFASMPTEKFESMLKSIRVPIWLSKNLAFYVDASTGADTLDDGRGLSVSKPFKTIRAAVEYIANNYNLGKYIATVYIGAGIYGEDINLPKYNSTTGYIYLRGIDEDRGQVVINGCIYAGTSVGVYYFRSVTVRNRAGESSIGSKNFFAVSARPGAELQLYNLGIDLSSAAPSLGDKYGIVAMGGTITIRDLNEDDIGLNISSGSAAIAQALRGTEGGKIFMLADISISGAVGATLALSGLAIFDVQTMTERDNPKFVGYVTGRRYSVNENSIAKTHGRGPDFIPGDSAGLIDTGGQYS